MAKKVEKSFRAIVVDDKTLAFGHKKKVEKKAKKVREKFAEINFCTTFASQFQNGIAVLKTIGSLAQLV
ncbi:MAG: hypothetical protein J6R10_02980 [Tidjanibacter sp.]|nr:hypothetical protein [Tidjanibacter sp.]